MLRLRPSRRGLLAAGLIAAALTPAAHGLERVNLRNGFSYDCARSQPLDSSHVRLYLTPDASNFIDLASAAIASIETLPNPQPDPAPSAVHQPANSASLSAKVLAPMNVPELLARAGAQHNIDVELLASVVQAESDGRPQAISRAGAEGLMQLMPGTAQQLGVTNAFRPDQNIAGGAAYLDALLTRYNNDLTLALAAYNAGPAAVDHFHGVPPFHETRAYVVRVENEFKRRKLAQQRARLNLDTLNQTTLASR